MYVTSNKDGVNNTHIVVERFSESKDGCFHTFNVVVTPQITHNIFIRKNVSHHA